MKYQKLFSPITVGGVTLKNRFAMAPMGPAGPGRCQWRLESKRD